jgi:hypothetical protein
MSVLLITTTEVDTKNSLLNSACLLYWGRGFRALERSPPRPVTDHQCRYPTDKLLERTVTRSPAVKSGGLTLESTSMQP